MGVTTGRRSIVRYVDGQGRQQADAVAVESPLTLFVDGTAVVTTMRTPGHDLELAAGWLVNESGVRAAPDIRSMGAFTAQRADEGDAVHVALSPGVEPPRPRSYVTSAACGVCSSDVISEVAAPAQPLHDRDWHLPVQMAPDLIRQMRARQRMFDQTGSLHGAAIADRHGTVRWVREDVGRHNAVDKCVGHALLNDELPLANNLLVVSGRVSFEIVHKALTAGVAGIVAVSGPTSLAVDLAREHGLVLIGFAREDRLNVYAGQDLVTERGVA